MSALHLYLVLLGGKHAQAHIEVHDLIPVVATDLPSAFPYLKQKWFGLKQGLHVDSWMHIQGVSYQGQNYQVQIHDQPDHTSQLKLFLVNLGAYVPHCFGEIHKYSVVAAENKQKAKVQAKLEIEKNWVQPHTDAVIDIDDCLELTLIEQKFIHLVKAEYCPNYFENEYIVIE